MTTIGAPPRQTRFYGRRPRDVESGEGPEPLIATRLTVANSREPMESAAAGEWLEAIRRDESGLDDFVANGVAVLNRAIHAQRAASMDPYLPDVSPDKASAIRVGYGTGLEVADGLWSQALRLPPEHGKRRRRRADALKPQERVASVLGGHERVAPFETMILRARMDIDQGRAAEAALQLKAGVDSLLAEIPEGVGGDELRDLELLDDAREGIDAASPESVAEALAVAERIMRRRRILG